METAVSTYSKNSAYTPSIRLTYEDYCEFPDDGKRYEIIDGELFMAPAPITAHQRASIHLEYYIFEFLKNHPIGEVFHAPCDVLLSQSDIVEPDIFVVLKENEHIITSKNIDGTPDFIVEILSPYNRRMDLKRKRALYEKFGVKEYWIVDTEMETIQKLVLKEQQLVDGGIFEAEQKISSEVISGFEIDVKNVFNK
ncbi:MAG: Uma2 family endonuclease [Ignavibacteriales bacterium]|nr:Uma2 family endonuclease [Ignavibacteriales bacterium]